MAVRSTAKTPLPMTGDDHASLELEAATGVPSDAALRARAKRYRDHFQYYPYRASQLPEILAGLAPEFGVLEQERQAAIKAEASIQARFARWAERRDTRQADHAESVRKAMLADAELPEPLEDEPWRGPENLHFHYDDIHYVILQTEAGLVDEFADELGRRLASASSTHRTRLAKAQRDLAAAEEAVKPFDAAGEFLSPTTAAPAEPTDAEKRVIRPTSSRNAGDEAEAMNRIQQDFQDSRAETNRSWLTGRR